MIIFVQILLLATSFTLVLGQSPAALNLELAENCRRCDGFCPGYEPLALSYNRFNRYDDYKDKNHPVDAVLFNSTNARERWTVALHLDYAGRPRFSIDFATTDDKDTMERILELSYTLPHESKEREMTFNVKPPLNQPCSGFLPRGPTYPQSPGGFKKAVGWLRFMPDIGKQ